MFKHIFFFLVAFLLIGCGGGSDIKEINLFKHIKDKTYYEANLNKNPSYWNYTITSNYFIIKSFNDEDFQDKNQTLVYKVLIFENNDLIVRDYNNIKYICSFDYEYDESSSKVTEIGISCDIINEEDIPNSDLTISSLQVLEAYPTKEEALDKIKD